MVCSSCYEDGLFPSCHLDVRRLTSPCPQKSGFTANQFITSALLQTNNLFQCCIPHISLQIVQVGALSISSSLIPFYVLICPLHNLKGRCGQVCTMPQNVTSYGGTRSSVHQHTSRSSHHGPRSTGWLNGVVRTGCQATAARSADVTARHASLTATLPRPLNAMASPADGVKSARPAAGVSMNGVTGPKGVTKNSKANQSRPKRRFKENGTKRRRMKNPTAAMR